MRKSFLNYNYAFSIMLNSYFKKRWYPVHARKWTHFRLPWHNSPCTSLWLFFFSFYSIYLSFLQLTTKNVKPLLFLSNWGVVVLHVLSFFLSLFFMSNLIIHVTFIIAPNVGFENQVFEQSLEIPMITNFAPLLANLFLYSYEA